jgi:murein DD-endopeptidase MepM/ murein hydrolase activator NlpD
VAEKDGVVGDLGADVDEAQIRIGDAVTVCLGAGISLLLPAATVRLQEGKVVAIDAPGSEAPPVEPERWAFPVGSEQYPLEQWYCAQYHTYDPGPPPSGHTGLDLNVQVGGKGDVDRGQEVFAIAEGVVTSAGYSNEHTGDWLGCVVIRVIHAGRFLWVRYGHLAREEMTREGQVVDAGDRLGALGNYTGGAGGDHLHLDAALDAFEWNWYRSNSIRWVDPLPILRAHLDGGLVDRMLADEGG